MCRQCGCVCLEALYACKRTLKALPDNIKRLVRAPSDCDYPAAAALNLCHRFISI